MAQVGSSTALRWMILHLIWNLTIKPLVELMYSTLVGDDQISSYSVHLLPKTDLERSSPLRVDTHSSFQDHAQGRGC